MEGGEEYERPGRDPEAYEDNDVIVVQGCKHCAALRIVEDEEEVRGG